MNDFAERSTRKDVVIRARTRVWCHSLKTKGRVAGLHSISAVGDAIQKELPQPTPACWLTLCEQLPQAMKGILPKDCESRRVKNGETRLAWLVRSIDSLERFRGSAADFEAPVWALSSPLSDVPQQLSATIDFELRSLSLSRMSRDDSTALWGIPGNPQQQGFTSTAGFRQSLSFKRSVEFSLARTVGCSTERLLRCLYVLGLLHLESLALRHFDASLVFENAIDQVMESAEYQRAFGKFSDGFREALRSRIFWRRIEPLVGEAHRVETQCVRGRRRDQVTSRVRVDPALVGCVIVPISDDATRMSGRTFWSISIPVRGTG
jgi:hypothetical protein